jgi:hypothetical protein
LTSQVAPRVTEISCQSWPASADGASKIAKNTSMVFMVSPDADIDLPRVAARRCGNDYVRIRRIAASDATPSGAPGQPPRRSICSADGEPWSVCPGIPSAICRSHRGTSHRT